MTSEKPKEDLSPLQNAVFLLRQSQAKLAAHEGARSEPIAIVGMGCRFPGRASSPARYWQLLRDGEDAIREVPPDRWDVDEFYDPDRGAPGRMYTRWGGFIEQADEFDADFFGISPREAMRVDPQHRLLLEVAWEALEDAGIPPESIAQTGTGVYVGVIANDYALLQSRDLSDVDVFSGTGCSHAILANRVSYALNLRGPSITLDTACSSSLVTVHLACQSLRRRETDMALAGGVNLILSPEMTVTLCKAHMMSPDGRCKAFDASADGYVRGEGCGLLVLKRLSDARRDGDRILAVVRGTAVNHDGRSNGLSAPNGPAQEEVIRAALADGHVAPGEVGYIETHGTGTRLGDPIEMEALANVFAPGHTADRPLRLGSVKTNIGHLESAAGVAGLIKAVLVLQNGQIPPHLHLKTLNPLLCMESVPFAIPTQLASWPRSETPRRVGVSSFGFGGTNAHIVVEEGPLAAPVARQSERPLHLLALSGRSAAARAEVAERYADFLGAQPEISLADTAFTAHVGRMHFGSRLAVVAESPEQACVRLRDFVADPTAVGTHAGEVEHDRLPKIAFLFTGQGAQYAGMGLGLYETQPVFRHILDRGAECLRPYLDRPLLSLLDPAAGAALDQTGYTQPVMFCLQYALAMLWRSWGVEPTAVMGHSVGEFAAACVAGVFSFEDGLRLIAARARLMQALPPGGLMAAVMAAPDRVQEELSEVGDQVVVAALNGPQSVVISGSEAAVRDVLARLEAEGTRCKVLATSHAFHSHLMDSILGALDEVAATVPHAPPQIPIVANLVGAFASADTYSTPDYWSRHARSPVRFAAGMQALADSGCEVFLEIGPSPILLGMGRRCLPDERFGWLPSLRPRTGEWSTLLDSLAGLYVRGANVDWAAFDHDCGRQRIAAPTYPFQRRRYWAKCAVVMPADGGGAQSAAPGGHPLLGHRLVAAVPEGIFEGRIAANRPALLTDHRVQGKIVLPGAGMLEMALAASAAWQGGAPWTLRDVAFLSPLVLDKNASTVQTVLTPDGPRAASFRIVSMDQEDDGPDGPSFITHATGRLEAPSDAVPGDVDLVADQARFPGDPFDDEWRAQAARRSKLEYGPTFCWAKGHWVLERDALAEFRVANEKDHAAEYRIHPGLLDCTFQLAGVALPGAGTGIATHVPAALGRLQLFGTPEGPTWCKASLTSLDDKGATVDICLMEPSGRVLLQVEGLRLQRVPRDWMARLLAAPTPDWLHELAWIRQVLPTASGAPPPAAGRWLILDGQGTLGPALAERLEARGQQCEVVAGTTDPTARETAVKQFLAGDGGVCRGVIYLGALGIDGEEAGGAPDFAAGRRDGWGAVLDLVHTLAGSGLAQPPRLWLVTRGAQAAGEFPSALHLAQSPIWGLARVVAAEHPELGCTRIDLDPGDDPSAIDLLAEEIALGQSEDQIAYRAGERFVARLRHARSGDRGELALPRGAPYRAEILSRGELDSVALRPAPRQAPGPGQVEIKVQATGLNFRDVLNLLNLYPGDPGPLGCECAGEVVAVGEGVERLQIGDQVIALAPASFASYAITLAEFAVPLPAGLDPAAGATIPICFATAYHALCRVGQMQPGERVLIHSATGGVGSAAIQVARYIGAEIFATAGSSEKRGSLASQGISQVMDSRSLDFADEIMAATGGEGVDLVLNSLTGEAIGKGLSVLRPGGRFLELGKTDLWDQQRVDQSAPGVRFEAIALDDMMATDAQDVCALLDAVAERFADGTFRPLDLRVFKIRRLVDALRHMARAEHLGKVVIEAEAPADDDPPEFSPRPDGTYLVTGGLGGLGLRLAEWLVDAGALHLVLLGRSGASPEARLSIGDLEQRGVQIAVHSCDVSCRDAVAEMLASVRAEMPPLRGLFHLAGVLDDGVLREQTRERFDRVLAAKAMGAWHLHELTREDPLAAFVLFSSAASLLGSPGQGNYAAANAFLDALAHHRHSEELPALSVNWGSWAEVGMAARLKDSEGERWAAAGVGWIEPHQGLETLAQVMAEGKVQVGVLPINWPRFFERIPVGMEPPWLAEMAEEARDASGTEDSGPPELLEKLREVTPGERLGTAVLSLRQQAARVLAMPEGELPDPKRVLNELGFDSLTGVEFCNRVARSIGRHLNPAMLFDYSTIERLAGHVVCDILQLETDTPAGDSNVVADTVREQAVAEVAEMSEEDMDALVNEQIRKLQK